MNIPLIQSLFTTAKAQLTTIQNDVTTLRADLATMEALRQQLAAAGGVSVADWLKRTIQDLGNGFKPYAQTPDGPAQVRVYAAEPGSVQDTSLISEPRTVQAATGEVWLQ